ncbi:4Fe-4S dicluster domain-containing protein [Neoroseomonas oryzicola]|uniref:4Fe-4S dicluster domain-containing protein n=1 Tax=Neoroseomonas oryzicola TaxID=535904 RepID=A0A9X9WIU3_9PROT|nr:4Fe-4S dicluster domain-containing protein [Neoroseomonas oryzicola]MBR0660253.1 4Fe-4S dicluster domain-containing protein [Neoroseomonas oryzicola]NKE16672.1 4Fe-4S dicluster domain-containing protein [Neoroseomonas oryzicola]
MSGTDGRIALVCTCEDTMRLDEKAIARGCGAELRTGEQLCMAQLDRFLTALATGRPLTVACTAQAPLFAQEAEAAQVPVPTFVNIREHAGWSTEGRNAGAKMAALIAAAAEPMPATPLVPLESNGVTLVLGRDALALEAASRLQDRLDLTVLLTGAEEVTPPRAVPFPVMKGRARAATGWLGAFEVTVDGAAMPRPSSRARFDWGPGKDGAVSRADIVLDLTGNAPLFPTHEVRQGYLRADPADAAAVEHAIAQAGDLVGTFDKPRFITFEGSLCAHARNKRNGCTRCIDLCPTGAITPGTGPLKDQVVISAEICAGCGACAAVCPTGAATYTLPPAQALARRIRTLLLAYREAGGEAPALLLHDEAQGEPLLDALARHGDGLPARVLPLKVNEPTALDLSLIAGAFAWGASVIRVLLPARRKHGAEGLLRNIDYANAALAGLGLGHAGPRAAAIETDDPFSLGEALTAMPRAPFAFAPSTHQAIGTPREMALQAFRALRAAAKAPAETVPMPALAPFGVAKVATEGCTLCLACTSVCPTSAFSANPETPQLRFLEDACVQCGLCAATCPEKVISLEPRLSFAEAATVPQVVKEEEPAACARCGKLFGTKASIARVKAKLSAHWMFADPARQALLDLCEDCRVAEATSGGIDPYAGPERPVTKTTEDYLREAERAKRDKS